jgi:hypothetical protein
MTTEDDEEEERRDERKEAAKSSSGGGFFRNLRSQFSFSSLRRKSPKKQPLPVTVVGKVAQSNLSNISGPNFSPDHPSGRNDQPRMTSTPVSGGGRTGSEPRMTSTPLSSCADSSTNHDRLSSSDGQRTSPGSGVTCAGMRQSTEPRRSDSRPPSAGSVDHNGPVKFRTAALKNQYQRWSFAEQTLREGNHIVYFCVFIELNNYCTSTSTDIL